MILYIDTHDFNKATIALLEKNSFFEHNWEGNDLSETLLPNIEKLLRKAKTDVGGLEKIVVITGPGGFSRIRTAVAVGNSFAYALNIPILGLKSGSKIEYKKFLKAKGQKMVAPAYGAKPNISKPKRKF